MFRQNAILHISYDTNEKKCFLCERYCVFSRSLCQCCVPHFVRRLTGVFTMIILLSNNSTRLKNSLSFCSSWVGWKSVPANLCYNSLQHLWLSQMLAAEIQQWNIRNYSLICLGNVSFTGLYDMLKCVYCFIQRLVVCHEDRELLFFNGDFRDLPSELRGWVTTSACFVVRNKH